MSLKEVNKKSKFIKEILEYVTKNKADNAIKDKLIGLVGKEISKTDDVYDDIVKRLVRLEGTTREVSRSETKIWKHNPSNCIKVFRKFSTDDNWKWFTHILENGTKNCDYISNAEKEFNKTFSVDLNPKSLLRVKNFLFNLESKYYWLDFKGNKVLYSWKRIKDEWCDKNEGRWPNSSMAESPKINSSIEELKTFSDVVKLFKNTIEFRDDESDIGFYGFLRQNLELGEDFKSTDLREIKPVASSVTGIYIDKSLLHTGIKEIVNWVKQYKANSNRVEVLLNNDEDFFELIIKHCGSSINHFPKVSDKINKKIDGLGGNLQEIRKSFFGVCDFKIRSKLGDSKVYDIVCLEKGVDEMGKSKKLVLTPNRLVSLDVETDDVEYHIKIYKN